MRRFLNLFIMYNPYLISGFWSIRFIATQRDFVLYGKALGGTDRSLQIFDHWCFCNFTEGSFYSLIFVVLHQKKKLLWTVEERKKCFSKVLNVKYQKSRPCICNLYLNLIIYTSHVILQNLYEYFILYTKSTYVCCTCICLFIRTCKLFFLWPKKKKTDN